MRIQVTQDNIDRGVPNDGNDCMIAVAYREATGHGCNFDCETLVDDVSGEKFMASGQVEELAEVFDLGEKIRPFEIELSHDGASGSISLVS